MLAKSTVPFGHLEFFSFEEKNLVQLFFSLCLFSHIISFQGQAWGGEEKRVWFLRYSVPSGCLLANIPVGSGEPLGGLSIDHLLSPPRSLPSMGSPSGAVGKHSLPGGPHGLLRGRVCNQHWWGLSQTPPGEAPQAIKCIPWKWRPFLLIFPRLYSLNSLFLINVKHSHSYLSSDHWT